MTRRRRGPRPGRMHKFRIDEASFVDEPAQEGAQSLFMKRAVEPESDEGFCDYAKRSFPDLSDSTTKADVLVESLEGYAKGHGAVPVMTGEAEGHAHLVWLDGSRGGETTMQMSSGETVHHDHVWTINADGSLTVAAGSGHTHTADATAVMAAMQELLLTQVDVSDAVVDVVFMRAGEEFDVEEADLDETLKALEVGEIVAKYTDGEVVGSSAMPCGSFPIRCSSDLATAISVFGAEGDDVRVARHIVKRARVLGLEDGISGEILTIAQTGPAGDVRKSIGGQNVKTTDTVSVDDLQKKLDALEATNAELTKSLDAAKNVAELTDAQREFHKGLSAEEGEAFMSKSADARQAQIDEIAKGDPVEYQALDGTEYRKSAGEHTIRLAKSNDDLAKRVALAEADKAATVFEKRADEELSNYPGEVAVRAGVIKALEGIEDADLKKGAFELLKAGDTALATFGKREGTTQSPTLSLNGSGDSEAQLNELAKARVTEHGEDFYDAYEKVSVANPKLARLALDGK